MVLAGKILIGALVGSIPVATVSTVASLGLFSSSVKDKSTYQENNKEGSKFPDSSKCYLINAVSDEKEKLVYCLSGNYYWWKEAESNGLYKKVKSMKVKDSNQILISLEGGATTNEEKTLTAKNHSWNDFSEKNKELINNINISCSASSDSWTTSENDSLVCTKNGTGVNSPLKLSALTLWNNK